MKNKYFLTIALAFASVAMFAQDTKWTITGAATNWEVAENWNNGVPTEATKTVFGADNTAECIVAIDTAKVKQLVMGDGGDGEGPLITIKDGGSITTFDAWSAVGYNRDAELVVEAGGSLTTASHLWVAFTGDGTTECVVDIAGGTVTVGQMIGLDWEGTGNTGIIYVRDGGVLNLNGGFNANQSIGANSFIDVTGGTIVAPGDWMDVFTAQATAGKFTAEGGDEAPIIEYMITGEGETADTTTIIKSSTTVGFKNKIVQSTLGVYPNPATDVVYFKENVTADVQVYSITGEIVLRRNNVSQVNIETLKPGYYIIKAEADNRTFVEKLLVK